MSRIVLSLVAVALVGCGEQRPTPSWGALKSSPTAVDFGTVALSASGESTITFTNVGAQQVSLLRASIEGDTRGEFSLPDALFSSIESADAVTIRVRFNARQVGATAARFVVETDSPVTPSLVVPLTAYVPNMVMVDAGTVVDAGIEFDAGMTTDAGHIIDAGTMVDAGTTFDAGVRTGNVHDIAMSLTHVCAVMGDGGVRCWGQNNYAQLGTQTMSDVIGAVAVVGLPLPAVRVDAARFHSCAVLEDKSAWCWGTTSAVQPPSAVPVRVPLDAGAVDVAGGLFISCVRNEQRAVDCWGTNYNGSAVGNGTTTGTITVPTRVVFDAGVAQIVGGTDHMCALLDDGRVYCWGANERGQLGDGTTTHSPWPVQVLLDAGAVELSSQIDVSCALKTNSKVACWGYNGADVITDAPLQTSAVSVPVDNWRLPEASSGVSNGWSVVFALQFDGGVRCASSAAYACGRDGGSTGAFSVPIAPHPQEIVAGGSSACALEADGNVLCWGAKLWGVTGQAWDAGGLTPPIRPANL